MVQKNTQFNARIPESLAKDFAKTKPSGTSIQHVVAACVRLWVSLPKDLQIKLIFAESAIALDGLKPQDYFLEAVKSIAEKVYDAKAKNQKTVQKS